MIANIRSAFRTLPAHTPARPLVRHLLPVPLALFLLLLTIAPGISLAGNKKIAVFGSSVAKGSGDTTATGGYAGMIKTLLEQRGWSVVNVSRGGDNTIKIMPRFPKELLPEKPGYVILGLSLGNEGIASSSELARNRVFERFRSGMARLINLCRENGMIPVVVNCYPRNDFGQPQYEAVQKMNLLMNMWDVPVINALGAIDNGKGNWADGCWHDKSHPNEIGHREIFYAFVPSLFDALASGKRCPDKIRSSNYLSISAGAVAKPLVFTPDDTIHSFTVSFLLKSRDEGAIAAINGRNSHSSVSLKNGRIVYQAPGKEPVSADTSGENKGWQYVVLSHRHATGMTTFYVNGKPAGSLSGPLDFREFILGGAGGGDEPSPRLAGYKDLLIYRSALNADEVTALYYDQLLPSSLEVYAPLDDPGFRQGTVAENHAQSMSKLVINGGSLVSATEASGTTIK
jgi:hypothetical protein